MVGPISLLGYVEQWLVGHWYTWPSYLRAGVWVLLGWGLAHWLF